MSFENQKGIRPGIRAILSGMNIQNLLSSIDAEIARLKQARALLASIGGNASKTAKPKRRLSLAARKRIAAAQRKRWAAVRKAETK